MRKIKRYIKRTWKNKIVALLALLCGIISAYISGDSTALLMVTIIWIIPLWFAKDNMIE